MPDFEAAGVWVVAISNDPVGAIAQFCDEHAITYDFLSDDGSALIRQLGILNDLIEPEDPLYGIPFPGAYLLDEQGRVVQKYFHREYQVREVPAFVLAEGFGLPVRLDGYPSAAAERDGVRLEATMGAPDLKFRQRAYLHVRLERAGEPLTDEARYTVSGEGVSLGAPRTASGETRYEVSLVERDLEAARVHVSVRLRAGGSDEQYLGVTVEIPVGELNRARRA